MELWKLPEGWAWKKMSEISIINPRRPRIQRNDDAPTSFVPMQAVDELEGKIFQMQIRPYVKVKSGYNFFEENDVLFAKITPSMENGKAAIARGLINGLGFGSTEFHVFHPNPGILPEWIFYYIRRKSFREEARKNFRGAVGQQRVPEDFLIEYPIPLPYPDDPQRSLAEQRRIVARLEMMLGEVREMRATIREMRKDVDRLMEAVLGEAFSEGSRDLEPGRGVKWGERKLEEVVEIHDRSRKPVKETDRVHGNVPYCGANGVIDYVEGYTHEGEFVLLAEDGGKFGAGEKSAYFMSGKFWANNHVHILRGKFGLLETRYLLFALNYLDLTPYLTGTTRPKLTQGALRKIPIPLPYPDDPQRSLAEQRRIVARLEAIYQEIRAMQELLDQDERAVNQLEQSILAAAFRGEI